MAIPKNSGKVLCLFIFTADYPEQMVLSILTKYIGLVEMFDTGLGEMQAGGLCAQRFIILV